MALVSFDASDDERYALLTMVEHQCQCHHDPEHICSAHMILKDEALIKRLLFVRRNALTYVAAEMMLSGPA